MEAAQPLDGDDRPAEQCPRGGLDGVAGLSVGRRPTAGVFECRARPALRARVGLCVEAAVAGILVLAPAFRAHGESRHRGVRAVVGNVADDREPWPAVGAVGERVAKAAIAGVEDLGEAVGAGGAIGRDRGPRLAVAGALANREAALAGLLQRLGDHPLHVRQGRGLGRQPREEALDRLRRRLDFNHHAARIIEHVPGHAELPGQPVDVWAKADSLDRALDARADAAQAELSWGRLRPWLSTRP